MSEYTYHITGYKADRTLFGLVFYFTEAKAENTSEPFNGKSSSKNTAVILKLLEF